MGFRHFSPPFKSPEFHRGVRQRGAGGAQAPRQARDARVHGAAARAGAGWDGMDPTVWSK